MAKIDTKEQTMNLKFILSGLQKIGLDGWLLFDHHERDPLACRVVGLKPPGHFNRCWSTTSTGAPMSLSDTNTADQPQLFYRLEAANP
jgi:hypothetical protein